MQSIHTSLNGLINKLFTKYGADKARSIMSTTYGRNMTEQEMMTCINMDNQNKADHPASVTPVESKLDKLRRHWLEYHNQVKRMDGRTALAKQMKGWMDDIQAQGEQLKLQGVTNA